MSEAPRRASWTLRWAGPGPALHLPRAPQLPQPICPTKGEGEGRLLPNEQLVSAAWLIMWFHVIKKLISAVSIKA